MGSGVNEGCLLYNGGRGGGFLLLRMPKEGFHSSSATWSNCLRVRMIFLGKYFKYSSNMIVSTCHGSKVVVLEDASNYVMARHSAVDGTWREGNVDASRGSRYCGHIVDFRTLQSCVFLQQTCGVP